MTYSISSFYDLYQAVLAMHYAGVEDNTAVELRVKCDVECDTDGDPLDDIIDHFVPMTSLSLERGTSQCVVVS